MKSSNIRRIITREIMTVIIDALGKDVDPESLVELAIEAVNEQRKGSYGKAFDELRQRFETPEPEG